MAREWIVLCLGVLFPGAGAAQELRLPEVGFNPPGATAWKSIAGPEGQRIDLPPGFQVRFLDRGVVQVLGEQGSSSPSLPYVLILPFIARPEESASGRLRRVLLPQLRGLPSFLLERFVVFGPARAALRARYATREVPRQVVALAHLQGRAGMIFLISAPFQGFDQARNTLTRIAMSLRYGKPDEKAEPLAAIGFTTWRDPVEGAFGLDVPAGWQVEGGLLRRGPMDLTPRLTLTAPDGGLKLFLNDRRNRLFLEPEPLLVAAGFHEGRWFSPAAGQRLHVLGHLPGTLYLTRFLWATGCEVEWQILLDKSLPELAEQLAGLQPVGAKAEVAAGSLLCVSRPGQEPWRGSFLVATHIWTGADDTRTWAPLCLVGWQARPGKEKLADQVLQRTIRSLRFEPSWAEAEGGLGRTGARALEGALREMAETLERSYAEREHALARALGPVLGPGHERDEATGDLFFPARGHNYFWLYVPSLAEGREEPDVDLTPLADL